MTNNYEITPQLEDRIAQEHNDLQTLVSLLKRESVGLSKPEDEFKHLGLMEGILFLNDEEYEVLTRLLGDK